MLFAFHLALLLSLVTLINASPFGNVRSIDHGVRSHHSMRMTRRNLARTGRRGLASINIGEGLNLNIGGHASNSHQCNSKARHPTFNHTQPHPHAKTGSCFPSQGFNMPQCPPDSLDGWWCNPDDEYAFLGFSYEITSCQSQDKLNREFMDARKSFNARYVRIYGACDSKNYYDKVVEAAWNAGIGVKALIWFGFDGDDKWKQRRNDLVNSIKNNPKAAFVTRSIQFGTEPLFDQVLPPEKLADEVRSLKGQVHPYGINVTVSDLVYGFQQDKSGKVLDAIDAVDVHMLPYFAQNASTGAKGFLNDVGDQAWVEKHAPHKRVQWTENGWPSQHKCPDVCPNSPNAVSNTQNEEDYFDKLNKNCAYFRQHNVGWYAHIYSDSQEMGYGIYDTSMQKKFKFHPRTECEDGDDGDDDDEQYGASQSKNDQKSTDDDYGHENRKQSKQDKRRSRRQI